MGGGTTSMPSIIKNAEMVGRRAWLSWNRAGGASSYVRELSINEGWEFE